MNFNFLPHEKELLFFLFIYPYLACFRLLAANYVAAAVTLIVDWLPVHGYCGLC